MGWLNHQPVQIAHLQNQSSYYGTFPVDPHDFLDGTNDTSNAPLNDTQNTALEGTCIQIDPNRASSLPISDQQSLLKQLILNHQSLIQNKLFHHFMVSWQDIFQNWDRDGSGDISVAELTRVLKRLCLGH